MHDLKPKQEEVSPDKTPRAQVTMIAAVADNNVIGNSKTNRLPWDRIPEDLPRFKKLTVGEGNNAIIMGRKTFESFGSKALPNRINIVLTNDKDWTAPAGVIKCRSMAAAIQRYELSCDDIYIIGGASIYKEGLEQADAMILTRLHIDADGDVLFPDFDPNQWRITKTVPFPDYNYDLIYMVRSPRNGHVH